MLRLNVERFLLSEGEQAWPVRVLRILMYPLAVLYGRLQSGRVSLYRHGILRTRSLPCAVVSIGNLTVGGSGKTPLTIWLARKFLHNSMKVAVLTRGYGRKRSQRPAVICDGRDMMNGEEECGDEPLLIASSLGSVPVLVGKDRYTTGRMALEQFGIEVLVLDDGFQHLRLARTFDIVLLPRDQDVSTASVLPSGMLREPLSALERADCIIITGSWSEDASGDIADGTPWYRRWNSDALVFHATLVPGEIYEVSGNVVLSLDDLQGKNILAFCGIARPARFLETLQKLGIRVSSHLIFPDHHRYAPKDLTALRESLRSSDYAITTEKDAVKLRHHEWAKGKLLALKVSVRVQEEEDFWSTLLMRLKAQEGNYREWA